MARILVVDDEEYDRIKGFELGIDDYVVKLFSPKEYDLRGVGYRFDDRI